MNENTQLESSKLQATNASLPVIFTLKQAWQKVYGSKKTFWAAIGIIILIVIGLSVISWVLQTTVTGIIAGVSTKTFEELMKMQPWYLSTINIIFAIIINIIEFLLMAGLILMGILRARNESIKPSMIFKTFKGNYPWNIIGTLILTTIIIAIIPYLLTLLGIIINAYQNTDARSYLLFTISIIAFIVSFIIYVYFVVRMSVAYQVVLDENCNPWKAVKKSWQLTKNHFWSILSIIAIIFCFCLLSIITLGIGFIWVMPWLMILYGQIYKNLTELKSIGKISEESKE